MIYLVNQHYSATIQVYLSRAPGRALAERIRVVPYEELATLDRLPFGSYVFTDFTVSTPAGLRITSHVYEQLSAAGKRVRLINDPRRLSRRLALLQQLHHEGLNEYRAVRATDALHHLRFPVFVREENAHTGSLTALIHGPVQLQRALRRLTSPLMGYERRHLLVVEFCDTSAGSGVFRTYAAYRVGDRIIRKGVISSRLWVTKSRNRILDAESIRIAHDYALGDQHDEWLWRIFDLAGVEYGRVDYGVLDGRPQLWEINTNPTISGRKPRAHRVALREGVPAELLPLFDEGRERYHTGLRAALEAIDLPESGPGIELRLDRDELELMRAERKAENRRRRTRRRLRRVRTVARRLVGRRQPEEFVRWTYSQQRRDTAAG